VLGHPYPTDELVIKMDSTDYQSNLDARIAFKMLTGLQLRLRPYETVVTIAVQSPTQIVVKSEVYDFDERRTETFLTAKGTRLIAFQKAESGWSQSGKTITVWDPSFSRIAVNHYAPGKTEGEWLTGRAWDRLAYRPGSDAQPMDSFYRTTKGYTPAKMARHW
jgi:hypothetical protein